MASAVSFGDVNAGLQIGVNHAPVTTQVHPPPERPETPPSPLSTVPFRPDPDFIARGTLLDEIHEKRSQPAARIALVGLGGVGKSQLALKYCYWIRELSPETWVFWIHGSNASRFEQSCREIADRVKIPGRNDPKADIFYLIQGWLQDEKKGKWVLVLDSVDNDSFLCDVPQHTDQTEPGGSRTGMPRKPLMEYLPPSQNGSIIMTSRNKGVALNMVDDNDIITVEPMNESQALALFKKKLNLEGDSDDVKDLAVALEFMPLAIAQAAAYIKRRSPRCSVRQYLEKFRKNDSEKTMLLSYEERHSRRDHEAKNAILITWRVSFDHIREFRPSAADLLSLMSLCDRQGIPEFLLRQQPGAGNSAEAPGKYATEEKNYVDEDSTTELGAEDMFEDEVVVLRDYSFISVGSDETTFEMHRLVQLAMQTWLKTHGKLEPFKQKYIQKLQAAFPTVEYRNWGRCQLLFPHAKSALTQRPGDRDSASLLEWALVLHNAACYAIGRGNLDDAERLLIPAENVREELLGPENEATLRSMGIRALIYRKQGRWAESETLNIQVMETSKKVLGLEHPDTLISMSNLACIYNYKAQWAEAESLQSQVLKIRKTVLGPEHPDTLISMTNLAFTFCKQKRWPEAEALQVQVVETSKTVLGPDHPSTLSSMNNRVFTFHKQKRWAEAEALEAHVMETRRTVLGPEHPDTLISMTNLAFIFCKQKRWPEAEALQVRVMKTSKTVLGSEHPNTLVSMNNLALIFYKQERWAEAEPLQTQVMETRRTVLGPEHPDTLASMSNLAYIRNDLGRHSDALNLMSECVQLRRRVLGPYHPYTVSSSRAFVRWQAEISDTDRSVPQDSQ